MFDPIISELREEFVRHIHKKTNRKKAWPTTSESDEKNPETDFKSPIIII